MMTKNIGARCLAGACFIDLRSEHLDENANLCYNIYSAQRKEKYDVKVDMPNGLDIINGLRKRLADYIAKETEKVDDIDDTYNKLTGYLAVADALDIITDEEYTNATGDLYHLLVGFREEPLSFTPLDDPKLKEQGLQEILVIMKIKLQERLNENFSKYRSTSIVLMGCSKEDVVEANDLMLTFAVNFNIITQKDFEKASKVMKEYASGKPKTEKIIFVPEAFYTKL